MFLKGYFWLMTHEKYRFLMLCCTMFLYCTWDFQEHYGDFVPFGSQMTWPSHFGSNPTAWTIIRDVYCWCASNKSKRKYHSKQNRVTSSIPVKPRMFDTFQQRASHAAMTSRGNSKSEMFYQNMHYHDPAYSSTRIISCFWQQVEAVHLLLSLGTGDTKCLMSIWHVRLHKITTSGRAAFKKQCSSSIMISYPIPSMYGIFTYILWQM